ncbi:hypothetical protein ABZ400_36715 [Streptomyces sp. NPDC005897]|jgi:hypothetical protein|uniref:hypothetical protein n=1 Tax=Streptomyces sp. NPDC005897 TaxID=3157081 RepID=UPI0033E0BEB9
MPEGLTEREWKRILLLHPFRQQLWLYYPSASEGGFEVLRVCDRTGWDAAILSWHTCMPCRRGHIAKISIADHWQRHGLGRRLVLRAMHGAGDFHWTRAGQSPESFVKAGRA